MRGERGEAGPLRGLRLLAAERPAHPPALAHDRRVGRAEHARDEVLHLGGVLGRGMDPHLVVLAGNGKRHLPFEVEVLLAADAHDAVEPVRCGGDCLRRLAAPELVGRQHLVRGGEPVVQGDAGSLRIGFDARAACGAACGVAGRRDHREHHLPVKQDLAGRENRVVPEGGAAVVHAGNVVGGQNGQHSREVANRVEVDRSNRPAPRIRAAGSDVHRARGLGQIVDVGGASPNVARRAVVDQRPADARAFVEVRPVRERGVGDGRTCRH